MNMVSPKSVSVTKKKKKFTPNHFSYLWRDDVKQISCQSVLLSKDVVLVCFKGDAVHVDDEGAGRQVEGDAVLSQEALQLGGLLPQKLQGHFCAWKKEDRQMLHNSISLISRFFLFFFQHIKVFGGFIHSLLIAWMELN